jgi:hypothetical protein
LCLGVSLNSRESPIRRFSVDEALAGIFARIAIRSIVSQLAGDDPVGPTRNAPGLGCNALRSDETSKQNLTETMLGYSKIGDNLVAFLSGNSYDASRILLIEKIRDLGLSGRPVAVVPNRNSVYITGADDETGLTMMVKLAADAMNDQYGLSGVPLVLDGDQ